MQIKIYYSWINFDKDIDLLSKQIRGVKSVYGVPRGGLIAAVVLSHRLNLPLKLKPEKDSLIVDDINDSGKTLSKYNQKTAVLLSKPSSKTKVTFKGSNLTKIGWVVFPWE